MGHKVLNQALTFHFLRSMNNKAFLPSLPAVWYLLGTGPRVRMGGQGVPRLPPRLFQPPRPQPQPFSPHHALLRRPPDFSPPPSLGSLPGPPLKPCSSAGSSPRRLWSTQDESQVGFHPGGPRFTNQRRSFNALPSFAHARRGSRQHTAWWVGTLYRFKPYDWSGPVGSMEAQPLSITPSLR